MKHQIKLQRAIKQANIFKGETTVSAIKNQLPESLLESLNSKDIAIVLESIDKAYKLGQKSTGASMIDSNCVWIESLNKGIEWNEVGAKFESLITQENGMRVTRPVKLKDGELVLKFSE